MNDKHLEVLKELQKMYSKGGQPIIEEWHNALTYAITQLEKPVLERLDEGRIGKVIYKTFFPLDEEGSRYSNFVLVAGIRLTDLAKAIVKELGGE